MSGAAALALSAREAMLRQRRRVLWRVLLAGPLVFVCAALVMCGGALWLPAGRAQIDNLVLPIVLFPAIWAALFFYACLDRQLHRAYWLIGALGLLHAAMIAVHLWH
jgi:hypothetical protein